ncbi:HAD hydrolase-like protein [Oscillospiraceae bacterium 21-37]
MKKYFLFDLDGTITDTGEGIMKSAQYALTAFGFPQQTEAQLRRFVGPPLQGSFETFYGLSPVDAARAVEKYRERYRDKGVFESPLYPGMVGFLERLRGNAVLCLATSKPLVFARQILSLRGVEQYFTCLSGAELDGARTDKAEVIAYARELLENPPKDQMVMVGDRRQDVLGAKAQGVESVGVLYGYSDPGELWEAGATHLVSSVEELEALCFSLL